MRAILVVALAMVMPRASAAEITRTEVIDRAKAYVFYPWRATAANQTATCTTGYESAFVPGDYVGVAYDWGGWISLFDFDQKIEQGYGAGSPAFGDVFWCTVGVDCSGFVSRAWQTSQKYGTATIHQVSSEIPVADILPGDVFNKASYHVAMYSHLMANGEPYLYEAVGFNTHINPTGGWSYINGFLARRFESIAGASIVPTDGTLNDPIVVPSFPYTDSRSTIDSLSDLIDGCGAQPGANESGPEVVYQIQVTEPGALTVAVSDDASADIDVHLYESWNTSSCVARDDASFTHQVDCGTYWVVADTYGSDGNAGLYDLTMAFAPSGLSCGSGPSGFDPSGGLGSECAYPGQEQLPFCNPTLGGDVCLYTSGANAQSFCTAACAIDGDCSELGSGSCCADIGGGEHYCLVSDLCEAPEDEPEPEPEPEPDPNGEDEGSIPGVSSGSEGGGSGCQMTRMHGMGSLMAGFVLCLALLARRRRFPSA